MAIKFIKESRNWADYQNHIDKDGDLDAQYALNRNVALTGKFINGVFRSDHKRHFMALIECGVSGCPTCRNIFVDLPNKNYNIKPWYIKNVIIKNGIERIKTEINHLKDEKWLKKPNSQVSALQEIFERSRKNREKQQQQEDRHPLYNEIMRVFKGEEIK